MNENIEKFFEQIDAKNEKNELNEEVFAEIAMQINSTEELGECLPEIVKRINIYKSAMDQCDAKSNEFSTSKKAWKARAEKLTSLMMFLMEKMNVKSIKAEDNSAKISSRDVLEVNDANILSLFNGLIDQMQQQLPPYVKIAISIDKRALGTYLQTDNSLMIQHPEWVHTKESKSIRLS